MIHQSSGGRGDAIIRFLDVGGMVVCAALLVVCLSEIVVVCVDFVCAWSASMWSLYLCFVYNSMVDWPSGLRRQFKALV